MAEPLVAQYRNWRGEVSQRRITPERIFFRANNWHREPQWLIEAYDHDKQAKRIFAFAGFIDLDWCV